jgi:tetratricopeptide (TPR) repeat protein
MNLGNAYLRQQNFASAWETLNLALEVARKNGEYRVYGRALLNLGMAGVQLKKADAISMLEEALEWYRNDTEIYPSIEREAVMQDGLRLLSQVARQTGDTVAAEKYNTQFMELINQDPDRYGKLRASPCFAIYQARPMPSRAATGNYSQP